MSFLRWLGSIVVFFWVIGFLFKIAGSAIHLLLLIAVLVFIYDLFFGKKNKNR